MSTTQKKRSKRASVMLRYTILSGVILLVAAWIAYNTFRNAVIDRPHWDALAQKELSRISKVIEPERGDILAADGSVLATTLQYYTLRIDFGSDGFDWEGYVKEKDALADSLDRYFPQQGGLNYWRDKLDGVLRSGKSPRGWRLIRGVTYADYMRIKEFPFFQGRKSGKNGLLAEPMKRRCNPYGSMAKLSIGVMSEDTETGEVHGMSGLERALDNLLYGTPGVSRHVTFTRGIGSWEEKPAVRGWDVHSTIDVNMQDIVENALLERLDTAHAEWGTAILMEVKTGEIKAISNLEEDPENPGQYIEAMNRAVRAYEPGSVVKTLSLMIAIEDGYVKDLDSLVQIGATYNCFGLRPAITDSHYNSELTVKGCIEQSSNIGVAKIMSRYYRNPRAWHDRVASLGFLEPLKSGIWEEAPARFPVPENGALVTLSRQFYGYGCEIPPLHTLSLYNAIANDGVYVRPRLVRSLHRAGEDSIVPVDYVVPRACSPATAAKMRECLREVVEGAHGTARSLKNEFVAIAGKTGTAYSADRGSYNKSCKRLAFCGFFPADEPKYSCMVLIYHPRNPNGPAGAASTSGVAVRNVALALHARGLLGNSSDYRATASEKPGPLTMYASAHPDELQSAIASTTGATRVERIAYSPKDGAGTVPNVMGMGLNEAVSTIERAGMAVTFSGAGRVSSQNPAPGEPPAKTVKLKLEP